METATANLLSAPLPARCSSSAHCAMKHSSATVAALRPTTMLDSGDADRQMRSRSILGKNERKAHTAV